MNGIVISGVITWIEVNKDMAAEGIWKEIAAKKWNCDETTAAKKALVNAGGTKLAEIAPEPIKTRQARTSKEGKKTTELDDIMKILVKMNEQRIMPLVLASTEQIRINPQSLGSIRDDSNTATMATRVIALEEAILMALWTPTRNRWKHSMLQWKTPNNRWRKCLPY